MQKTMQFVRNYIIFLKSNCVFFTPINSSYYSVHKNIEIQAKNEVSKIFYILYKKCVNFVNSSLKEHLSKKDFIVVMNCSYEKLSRSITRICNKK